MPTIQQLVARAIDGGASASKIAEAMGISRAQVYKVKDGAVKSWPRASNVEPLARVLDVNPTLVLLAYARTLGVPVRQEGSRLSALLPPAAERLTAEQVDALIAVIRAMAPVERATPKVREIKPRNEERRAARKPSTPRSSEVDPS